MKNFFLHAWGESNVKKTLKKINKCIENKQQCKLWIMCAEEYDYILISNHKLSTFIFDSNFVETILVLGVLEHHNLQKYTKHGIKVVLWRNFWFYKTVADVNVDNLRYTKRDFKKLFICLNNRGHPHRVKTINSLIENDLLKDGIVSWHDENIKPSGLESKVSLKSEKEDNYYEHILPQEFNDCLINLITESSVDDYLIDISEKTINAIISGMPFVIIGSTGIHNKLEQLGFKLYTEIFNYEFDNFKNLDKRINDVVEQLINFKEKYNKKYNLVYKSMQDKIRHNRHQLIKIINEKESLPEEVTNFSVYSEMLEEAKLKCEEIRRLR